MASGITTVLMKNYIRETRFIDNIFFSVWERGWGSGGIVGSEGWEEWRDSRERGEEWREG